MKDDLAARAEELALLFTSWPSVTGTVDEASFAAKLAAGLLRFDDVRICSVHGDKHGRANVFALKRGRSRCTIVLTGHFDTVSFDDYDELAELALSPEKLTAAVIKALKARGNHPLALADLESGDYLPGRGLLDMKAGLAAGIAAMEIYAGDANLLFIAVCDEEERSAGARAAVPQLKAMADEFGLDIALVINLDSISDQGDGTLGRVVTYGSIGKQLLTAFVHGKQTHAGYPQDGVNAAYVAAELVTEFELSPELSERTGNELAAPPTALSAKDLKQGYNVTTPGQAWIYWNTMQHRRSAEDVSAIAMAHAARAVDRAKARTGHDIDLFSFAELKEMHPRKIAAQDSALNLPEQARLATLAAIQNAALAKPAVILGFGSIPYPAVLLKDQKLRTTISSAVKPFGVGEVNYFAGISDMSFFGESSGDLAVVAANTPIWGQGFTMPEPAGFPCINIGPWGRDYHHWLERLHAPYAFDTLPRVLLAVIDAVAKNS